MKTTDELVRELVDREAIRDLPIRYCDCLYRNDLEGLVSLFTKDGSFIVKNPENEVVTRGRTHLRKMYENLASDVHPRPHIHTHVVDCAAGTPRPVDATSRCTA
jgi:uncharacterized protein (TIGR02246 family)